MLHSAITCFIWFLFILSSIKMAGTKRRLKAKSQNAYYRRRKRKREDLDSTGKVYPYKKANCYKSLMSLNNLIHCLHKYKCYYILSLLVPEKLFFTKPRIFYIAYKVLRAKLFLHLLGVDHE